MSSRCLTASLALFTVLSAVAAQAPPIGDPPAIQFAEVIDQPFELGTDAPQQEGDEGGGYAGEAGADAALEAEGEAEDDAKAKKKGPTVLFPDSLPEKLFDFAERMRKKSHVPLSFAAWHWQHQNNAGPLESGYGIPGIRGTYWWSIYADPEFDLNLGPVSKAGMHTEVRLREQDQFRSFFTEKSYTWEWYGWVDTKVGRIKGGQIWKRFGLDWDGVFFGNVPYFDGFKLDPDIGFSWENTWELDSNLKLDSFVQFFVHDDGVNGTIEGSDAESLIGSNERNTGVIRLLPTWTLCDDSTLSVGASALVGQIENDPGVGVGDQVLSAWAVDVRYVRKNLNVFAEVSQSYGVLNPMRYTSGGPSNRTTNVLTGVRYTVGPVVFRFSYSAGFDENPAGWQQLWLPGVTVALTKNIDFYAEWTRWDIFNNAPSGHVEFEDGYSFVINWRF